MKKVNMITLIILGALFLIGIIGAIIYGISYTANSVNLAPTAYQNGTNLVGTDYFNGIKKSDTTNMLNDQSGKHTTSGKKYFTFKSVAKQGCEITDEDTSIGQVTYKEKCESCGYLSETDKTTILKGDTMESYFRCPKCKKTQKIIIETTTTRK
jgi:hypothetical protein